MSERPLDPITEARWRGMYANEAAVIPRGYVLLAKNFYLQDGKWRGRKGLDQLGANLAASRVQGIFHYEELDGTIHTVAICNADLFEYNWSTDSWSSTDLSVEGVTVDPSQEVSFANSRGRLIVTDGVNRPWMWDGTTFTVLTNAPIANGVAIYYDKVFFYDIPGEENSFQWSNEGDPENGYDAENQGWKFVQTDAGRIRSMVGLNERMLVMKQDSVAMLMGAVEDTFQTDAVREGVSETEGSIALRAPVVVDGNTFCLTQSGPRLIAGSRMVDISEDDEGNSFLRDIWSTVDRASWGDSFGVYDPNHRHVLWFVPRTGVSEQNYIIVFAIDEAAWSVFELGGSLDISSAAHVEDTDGAEWVLLGTESGDVLRYAADDVWGDNGSAIERILRSRQHGQSTPTVLKRLSEVHLQLDVDTDITNAELRAVHDLTVASGKTFSIVSADDPGRQRYRRGFNRAGYALGWELYLGTLDETINLEGSITFLTRMGLHGSF